MGDPASTWESAWVGDCHLRLALADGGPDAHLVRRAFGQLTAAGIPGLQDAAPACATLLLRFDSRTLNAVQAEQAVLAALSSAASPEVEREIRLIEIPVCYDAVCAPDLAHIGELHGLSAKQIVDLHSAAEYRVEFLGFAPGFAYLAGLPERIATPRLAQPRARVWPGSVGIADRQCGIYPRFSAGGWNLIGRTPLRMFDPLAAPPTAVAFGDRVRFVPIALDEFLRRGGTIEP